MAAATVTNRQEHVAGSLRLVLATVTVNNNDTWKTGLGAVLWQFAEPSTNNGFATTKGTGASSGVITFATSVSPMTFDMIAIGRR